LSAAITQSLAGRIALLNLLPMSLAELNRFPSPPEDLWTTVWTGGYPRIHDRQLAPDRWLAEYVATYVQRDVRQVLNVSDLDAFSTFLGLAAGRTARELHLSALSADVGVSHPTVRSWISVLETSFVVFRTPRWLRNVRKRAVKAPKIHFVDSGLACHLLGIRNPDQLRTHPLRGAVFESWVAGEILKARLHRHRPADLYHLRETRGIELDLVVEADGAVIGVEVKSGATVASDFFGGLRTVGERMGGVGPKGTTLRLVYGGDTAQNRSDVHVVPWREIQECSWV
jgi:predicted AAA+ superfamily ATPase